MKLHTIPAVLLMSLPILAGCQPQAPEHGPDTLVVDFAAVAKALGRDASIQQKLEQAATQLNTQLLQITTELTEQYEAEKARRGEAETLSEEDSVFLTNLAGEVEQRIQGSQQEARQKAAAYRASLIAQLREEVQREAARIARERDASSVMLSAPDLLWFDPEADITDEVIAQLRALDTANGGDTAAPDTQ